MDDDYASGWQLLDALTDLDVDSLTWGEAHCRYDQIGVGSGQPSDECSSGAWDYDLLPAEELLGASTLQMLQLGGLDIHGPSSAGRPLSTVKNRQRQISEDSCASILSLASWQRRSSRISNDSVQTEASLEPWSMGNVDKAIGDSGDLSEVSSTFMGFVVPKDASLLDRCWSGPGIFSVARQVEDHYLPGVGELRYVEDIQASSWARHLIQCCQSDECMSDLSDSKAYNKRKRLCSECMARSRIVVNGAQRRFCQQCGVLHPLEKFSGARHVCRLISRRNSFSLRDRWNRRKNGAEVVA